MMHNDLLFSVLVAHICVSALFSTSWEDDSGGLTEEDSQDGIKDPKVQISQAIVGIHRAPFWDIIWR